MKNWNVDSHIFLVFSIYVSLTKTDSWKCNLETQDEDKLKFHWMSIISGSQPSMAIWELHWSSISVPQGTNGIFSVATSFVGCCTGAANWGSYGAAGVVLVDLNRLTENIPKKKQAPNVFGTFRLVPSFGKGKAELNSSQAKQVVTQSGQALVVNMHCCGGMWALVESISCFGFGLLQFASVAMENRLAGVHEAWRGQGVPQQNWSEDQSWCVEERRRQRYGSQICDRVSGRPREEGTTLTSPIASYLWNFCHCLVRYYWCKMHDISRLPEHVHVAACMEGWTLVVSQLQGAPALAELHRRLFAATGLPFLGTHIGGLVAPVRLGQVPSPARCQGLPRFM